MNAVEIDQAISGLALERIFIGRRFKNDTERLEKLFDLYTKMTAAVAKTPARPPSKKAAARKKA